MNELITINSAEFGGELQQTVNARDLHSFLRVGRDFSNWIKDRVEQLGLAETLDFMRSPNLASRVLGGQGRIEYHLTIDAAKHIAMAERNDQGRIARDYFIEREKQARHLEAQKPAIPPFKISTDNAELNASLTVIQQAAMAADRNPEVIATLLSEFLRHSGVAHASAQAILTATCAEDLIDYGPGFHVTHKRIKTLTKQATKASRTAQGVKDAVDVSDPRMIAAIDLGGRPNAWMTSTDILRASGYKDRQRDLRVESKEVGRYLSSLSLIKKATSRGTAYLVHLRANAGQLPGSRGVQQIKLIES